MILFEESLSIIANSKFQKKWSDLSLTIIDSTFVLPEHGMPLRELVEREIFDTLRVRPKKIIEVNSNQLMKEFVRAGDYLTFVPLSSLSKYDIDPAMNPASFQVLDFKDLNISQRCVGLKSKHSSHQIVDFLFNGISKEISFIG